MRGEKVRDIWERVEGRGKTEEQRRHKKAGEGMTREGMFREEEGSGKFERAWGKWRRVARKGKEEVTDIREIKGKEMQGNS